MFDTIACLISGVVIDPSVFQGQAVTEDLETGKVTARMWLNPREGYAPNVTYWAEGQVLKIEASLSKMAGLDPHENMTSEHAEQALDLIDRFVQQTFGSLPSVREWTCQRIDYCWMWDCGRDISAYMTMLKSLRIGGMTRDVYDDGVVFKQGNRWIKFYMRDNMLRFEVSNYKQAVRYMCKRWFVCERTVSELVHTGRSLYMMALYLDKLGVDALPIARASLLSRLRDVYGSSASSAFYALTVIHEFGSASHTTLKLISSSSFYSWRKRLNDDGFVIVVDDDVVDVVQIGRLSLPNVDIDRNLKSSVGAVFSLPSPKNLPKKLGISGSVKIPRKLEMQYGVVNT